MQAHALFRPARVHTAVSQFASAAKSEQGAPLRVRREDLVQDRRPRPGRDLLLDEEHVHRRRHRESPRREEPEALHATVTRLTTQLENVAESSSMERERRGLELRRALVLSCLLADETSSKTSWDRCRRAKRARQS